MTITTLEFLHDNPPAPFNPKFRSGLREAIDLAYTAYCDDPDSPQESGPNIERAKEHNRIIERLKPSFPSIEDKEK